MELKINKPTFPEVIEFNFEELKAEITEKTAIYANMVYSADQLAVAKKDVATLRKFATAINDERKKIKKECLKPYEEFEIKIKELEGIVNSSISNIDEQVKAFDEQRKAEKLEKIKEIWENVTHPEWLTCKQIFDNKWLNVSTSLKKIEEEIVEKVNQVEADLDTLSELTEFSFEATEEYKASLDINKAIAEGKRLADIQKRKEEAKVKLEMAKETEMLQPEDKKVEEVANEVVKADASTGSNMRGQWISFKALLTVEDAIALKEFFDSRKINFEQI